MIALLTKIKRKESKKNKAPSLLWEQTASPLTLLSNKNARQRDKMNFYLNLILKNLKNRNNLTIFKLIKTSHTNRLNSKLERGLGLKLLRKFIVKVLRSQIRLTSLVQQDHKN